MKANLRALKVFISSPSDLNKILGGIEKRLERLNKSFSETVGVRFEYVSARQGLSGGPSAGRRNPYTQQVIDDQIKNFEGYIGFMWARAGTATPKASSGTIEEFELFFKRWKLQSRRKVSRNIPKVRLIKFYFLNKPLKPSEVDVEQLKRRDEFKRLLGTRYAFLYKEFSTPKEILEDIEFELHVLAGKMSPLPKTRTPRKTTTRPMKPTSANHMGRSVIGRLEKITAY